MEQKQLLQQMVLGDVDSYVQKTETFIQNSVQSQSFLSTHNPLSINSPSLSVFQDHIIYFSFNITCPIPCLLITIEWRGETHQEFHENVFWDLLRLWRPPCFHFCTSIGFPSLFFILFLLPHQTTSLVHEHTTLETSCLYLCKILCPSGHPLSQISNQLHA